jgi:hypothetical protein
MAWQSKPLLSAVDNALAWKSKKRANGYDTFNWSVALVFRGLRFPGSKPNSSSQRELGFMLWAGRSCVLKGPWCLEEEREMRKIRLRLGNGNLGAKWQNRTVVKGAANAAIVPTSVPPPTPSQPSSHWLPMLQNRQSRKPLSLDSISLE